MPDMILGAGDKRVHKETFICALFLMPGGEK